jgi:hypothetical protein
MKRAQLIDHLRTARAELLATMDGLPPDTLLRPYVVGMWSLKDLMAHLVAWESELITALAGIGTPRRIPHIVQIEDFDEFNEDQYRSNVRRPLDAIQEDFQGVHKHLIKAIETIDEAVLNDTRRFAWMEGEPLWTLIADNGYEHEREHAADVRRWRTENNL